MVKIRTVKENQLLKGEFHAYTVHNNSIKPGSIKKKFDVLAESGKCIEAIKHKIELKQHVSAKRIQKRLKGLLVRKRIYYLKIVFIFIYLFYLFCVLIGKILIIYFYKIQRNNIFKIYFKIYFRIYAAFFF
jgi:hypothetical protein